MRRTTTLCLVFLISITLFTVSACGSGSDAPTLVIGGIPDQNVSVLEERFGGIAERLEGALGFDVEYRPSTDYAALVTAFGNGDVGLGWFGGLTGVQARLAAPGAEAIVQRPVDEEFTSVFIVGTDVEATSLADLSGKTFTFGSESSTSGHLMPRYFLREAGITPEEDFEGQPGYSGSHDTTWQLVESGSYEAGALNSTVWERAVAQGQVDTSLVRVLTYTDTYWDYHWVAHPDLDETYGEGTTERITEALVAMSVTDPDDAELLDLFQAERFIETENSNYDAIEQVARDLGLIE